MDGELQGMLWVFVRPSYFCGFHAFSNKPLRELINWVGTLIMVLPSPDYVLGTLWWLGEQFLRVCSLRWRCNDRVGVSNHQPYDCLLNRLFRHGWKKTSKLRVTGLCEGNSPVTGEFPAQRASNAENVSIWWGHHVTNRSLKNLEIYAAHIIHLFWKQYLFIWHLTGGPDGNQQITNFSPLSNEYRM